MRVAREHAMNLRLRESIERLMIASDGISIGLTNKCRVVLRAARHLLAVTLNELDDRLQYRIESLLLSDILQLVWIE